VMRRCRGGGDEQRSSEEREAKASDHVCLLVPFRPGRKPAIARL
jgi:hypothetical protein